MTPVLLGVTGCVGAGKSTVCAALEARGWSVLDVDAVAAQALSERSSTLRQVMPEAVGVDGRISTRVVMTRMFERAELRQALESLVLEPVRARIVSWAALATKPTALESALLFEAGLDQLCATTLVLTCPPELRRARVQQRTTASTSLFDAIEGAQWPEAKKVERAKLTLATDCGLAELERRVSALATAVQGASV